MWLLALALLHAPTPPLQDSVAGKPVAYWIEILGRRESAAPARLQACKALEKARPASPLVPVFLATLHDDRDKEVRLHALHALAALSGADAFTETEMKTVAAGIATSLTDPEVAPQAIKCLSSWSCCPRANARLAQKFRVSRPAAVPGISAALRSEQARNSVSFTIELLVELSMTGPEARSAAPTVATFVDSTAVIEQHMQFRYKTLGELARQVLKVIDPEAPKQSNSK